MKIAPLGVLASTLAAASLAAQFPQAPGPDILLPDGSLDGAYRLVDKNGNGTYQIAAGEAYDYLVAGVNTSTRRAVRMNNGWLYACDVNLDVVIRAKDLNLNGVIDYATEAAIAFNPATELATGQITNPLELVTDGTSLYMANDVGTGEGIWKLTDLNGDFDFTYALGEVIGAIVETTATGGGVASVPVANAVNTIAATGSANCVFTDLQSMSWDPTVSPGSLATGRVIVENEANSAECSIAFEDKNGDGDFRDAGECWIFSNLCNDTTRTLYRDVSPDLATFAPAYAIPYYEIEHVLVDTTIPASPTYYLISEDSTGSPNELGIVFKGKDNNSDGDVNDAGETTVWFDCSADSLLGATTEYEVISGSGIYNGDVYLMVQRYDGNRDDAIIALRDLDSSGVIDQPNEVAVVHRQRNQTLYNATCFAPGVLEAPTTGNVGYYEYIDTTGTCMSTGGGLHNIAVGTTNWDDKVIAGNAVPIRSWGAAANSPLALHIGSLISPAIPLDGASTCLFSVNPSIVATPFASDPTGVYVLPVPITVGLSGFQFYWQYIALDAGATPYNVTTSDTLFTQLGTYSFTQH